MKINLTIECSVEEATQLIKQGLNEQQAADFINAVSTSLKDSMNTYPSDEKKQAILTAMERANFSAVAMIAQIVADETSLNGNKYIEDFDDVACFHEFLETRDTAIKRKISSRIGGLRKITDSVDAPPLATIERGLDSKVVEVNSWAKPLIIEYLQHHRSSWAQYIERYLVIDPLDIIT
ncbi:hypothetical protein [Alteromonas gracilis]|uniref:hypothetical protein n=1 Tax=Alteromonas gracilis TaxID=1479524 RepID=UPI00321C0BCE